MGFLRVCPRMVVARHRITVVYAIVFFIAAWEAFDEYGLEPGRPSRELYFSPIFQEVCNRQARFRQL